MSRVLKSFLSIATASFFALGTQNALAEKGDLSVSLKYSLPQQSSFDIDNVTVNPDPDNGFALAVGYEYDQNWTIEVEYITAKSQDANTGRAPINIKTTGFGVYGVYRTPQSVASPYFFGRIGFGKIDLDVSQSGFTGAKADESGLAFGAGAGYKYTDNISFEAEYFLEDADFKHILISARYMLNQL